MLIEMDEMVTLSAQMEQNISPVILINKFNVKPEDVDQLLKTWAADAAYFKQQPGFISTQLHRGIGGSCVFINYAVWESTQQFKEAFNRPEFKSKLGAYPDSTTTSPHLFKWLQYQGFVLISNVQDYNI
ncbi:MAG TPA: antibiotic biosynthesis monooxygenase family protein [Nitrososphaeraceae archaeon]|nr:antibiotic biosynthesis monooxygenase family protein [Nitrososphaeraceae archaeon]